MHKGTFSIVIAGHIDHGKSTLIGRMMLETHSLPEGKIAEIKHISRQLGKDTQLAFLTDQLEEERKQDKTIDTTQAVIHTRRQTYILIDAPGHAEFIKSMLTGASQAEAAIILVDATAGLKEQTRRHAYLISLLGIRDVIVGLNKMDLIDGHAQEAVFKETRQRLLRYLQSIKITPSFIIPLSAKEGTNISRRSRRLPWYRGPCLLEALDLLNPKMRASTTALRFAVQDRYDVNGEKITAGKVLSGTIKQKQALGLFPSREDVRVQSVRIFGKNVTHAGAGQNVGLILENPLSARRGQIIAPKDKPPCVTDRFEGEMFWMSQSPLQINTPFSLRCSTQEISCMAEKIERRIDSSTLSTIEENASLLRAYETGSIVFKTAQPIALEPFNSLNELGRFVVEEKNEMRGAGIIIRAL